MIWIWVILLVGVFFILVVAVYSSTEITSIPRLAEPYTPKDFGLAYEKVTFPSHDGLTLTGWFLPVTSGTSGTTIVVLHGLGSNSGDMLLNTLCLARAQKWNLFFINFRGHADSGGNRTSLGPLELKDLESGLAFIKKNKPQAVQRLAIYGHSLGAAVAIVGAAKHPELEAVAVESPFIRTRDTVAHFGKVYYGIPRFPFMYIALFITRLRLGISLWNFCPIEKVAEISPRPFFVIHAERDLRMPTADMVLLMAAARDPKELWTVPGADHGEPWMVDKEGYDKRMVEFFERALA